MVYSNVWANQEIRQTFVFTTRFPFSFNANDYSNIRSLFKPVILTMTRG